VWDLSINLAASAITGATVWLAQFLVRRRRLRRMQEFFGLRRDAECLLVVGRHAASGHPHSVHRNDVASLLELAGVVRECGARQRLVLHDEPVRGLGQLTEFCVGGPSSNSRTVGHLRWLLPGVRVGTGPDQPVTGRPGSDDPSTDVAQRRAPFMRISVGGQVYDNQPDAVDYLLVARVPGPADRDWPLFVICGQTSLSNHAGVAFLARAYPRLIRDYGVRGRFALVLRVVNPIAYGPHMLEEVADVTEQAFSGAEPADGDSASHGRASLHDN
jgi:hypothetical protein